MLKTIVASALISFSLSSTALAQMCSSYPYTTLSDGNLAYASQVMSNFTQIANCVNAMAAPLANPIFSGNVGIGMSPSWPLDVSGNARVSGGIFTQAIQFLPNNAYLYDANYGNLGIRTTDGTNYYYFLFANNGEFWVQNNGIYANGAVEASAFYAWSDERLKKNITPLTGALSIVQNLNPVRYQWRAASERTIGANLNLTAGESHLGFIAQQVAPVLPEAVVAPKDSSSPYEMKPMEMIAVLVEAVKEQQAEINQIQTQLASKLTQTTAAASTN